MDTPRQLRGSFAKHGRRALPRKLTLSLDILTDNQNVLEYGYVELDLLLSNLSRPEPRSANVDLDGTVQACLQLRAL